MNIAAILSCLESLAPLVYQESYDNCGLLTGSSARECTGVMVTLDTTEAVVMEAVLRKCNQQRTMHDACGPHKSTLVQGGPRDRGSRKGGAVG